MGTKIPISTIDLFAILDRKLIDLLHSISTEDWEKFTLAAQWQVKDVAAHLLDGNLRAISILRDNYLGDQAEAIKSYADLVSYLNRLNAEWVKAMNRLSPQVLIYLLETSGQDYIKTLKNLEPFENALFPVAWAGEEQSKNWFHIAREYTEKWHHQQQIRRAVGAGDDLFEEELFFPFLSTCLSALPFHYRELTMPEGFVMGIEIEGEKIYRWWLRYSKDNWRFIERWDKEPGCKVIMHGDIAWRIFTKGITAKEAAKEVLIIGDRSVGLHILKMLTVMA